MQSMRSALWLAALLALAAVVCAQPRAEAWPGVKKKQNDLGIATGFVNKVLKSGPKEMRYVVYVPYEYDPAKEWPLIMFLHGAGERGDDGMKQTEVGIGTWIRRHPDWFPALVIFPQCPEDAFWDCMLGELDEMLRVTREEYNIDASHITLTGLSMGGFGTWLWGALKTGTFAALLPICGGGSDMPARASLGMEAGSPFGSYKSRVAKWQEIPIWAFHGADDEVVPPAQTRQTVEHIQDAGGTRIRYTEYPETNHNSWDKTYGDHKVIKWLLRQDKNRAAEDDQD